MCIIGYRNWCTGPRDTICPQKPVYKDACLLLAVPGPLPGQVGSQPDSHTYMKPMTPALASSLAALVGSGTLSRQDIRQARLAMYVQPADEGPKTDHSHFSCTQETQNNQ